MNPEIKRFLDEHGATYTPDALRTALIQAGHDPSEVDSALTDWRAGPVAPNKRTEFRRWAIGLHICALVAMAILVVVLNGIESAGVVPIAALVLALFLLVGWAISGLIGRWLLPRTGLMVALIAPAVSALLLGGTCVAIMNGLTPPAPRPGSLQLRIDPPSAFQGSSDAQCFLGDSNQVTVTAEQTGTLGGQPVAINLMTFGDAQTPGTPSASLVISIGEGSETTPPRSYSSTDDRQLDMTVSADGLSGEMRFERLPSDIAERAPNEPAVDPISGTVTWQCR